MSLVNTRYGQLLAQDAAIIERFEKGEELDYEGFCQLDGAVSRISHGTCWDKYTLVYAPPTWKKPGLRTIEIRGPLSCNLTLEFVDDSDPLSVVLSMFTYFVFDNRTKSCSRRTVPIRNIKTLNVVGMKEWFPVEHEFKPVYW
jgi:hypothetical protein